MSTHHILDLALRLWPEVRDRSHVSDPAMLDELLTSLGQPGAPGYDCGLSTTFSCFDPAEAARLTLPTGEEIISDPEARLVGHVIVTRTLLAAGLHVDQRVVGAMADAYALSWAIIPSRRDLSASTLACTLWLIALDPRSSSDRPLPVSLNSPCCADPERWDPDYPLFSHYDIRERAIDWSVFASGGPARRSGCSIWTIVEPLLGLDSDNRVRIALASYAEAAESDQTSGGAAAMLERGRIAAMLQGSLGLTGA